MYIIRLDDASANMDIEKWQKIELMLDKYHINPIVGVIPHNEDASLISKYKFDPTFWSKVSNWQQKGWCIALHGYNHKYITKNKGINPINTKSEFAGVSLQTQKDKIHKGIKILKSHNINPELFFAPAHTFDKNTLEALRTESDIRIISDTVANNLYYKDEFYFIPQQIGHARRLPLKLVTFCYHPNTMQETDFLQLENFLQHNTKFISVNSIQYRKRKLSIYDQILRCFYFSLRYIKKGT